MGFRFLGDSAVTVYEDGASLGAGFSKFDFVGPAVTVTVNPGDPTRAQIAIPAMTASGWTDAGATVRLTTGADNVAMGNATTIGSEKLLVRSAVSTSLRVDSTVAGASGVVMQLAHAKAGAGGIFDLCTELDFIGNNDAGVPAPVTYGTIQCYIEDPTAGTESSILNLGILDGGQNGGLGVSRTGASATGRAGATQGPALSTLFFKGANGANADIAGDWSTYAPSDNGTFREFTRVRAVVEAAADGAEYGNLRFSVLTNGSMPATNLETFVLTSRGAVLCGSFSATEGPELALQFRKTGNGANGDVAAYLGFYAKDNGGAVKEAAYWTCAIPDAGAATYDTTMTLNMMVNNVDTAVLHIGVGGGLGVWGHAAPAAQPAKINDPAGGGTQDAEARAAINAIIDVLEGAGLASSV